MAPRRFGWVINLCCVLLLGGFAFCGFLVWKWRAPWRVTGTLEGRMPTHCGPHTPAVYVYNQKSGTVYFPDTRKTVQLPAKYCPDLYIRSCTGSRNYLWFTVEEVESRGHTRLHLWDISANREVPIPDLEKVFPRLSADESRLLISSQPTGKARIFQVRATDGALLHELRLPPEGEGRTAADVFSRGGRYVVEWLHPAYPGAKARIHDLDGGRSVVFGDEFADVFDDGVVLQHQKLLRSDGGPVSELSAVDLHTRKELWRWVAPEAVIELRQIDEDRLLLRTTLKRLMLLDRRSGRFLHSLEDSWNCTEEADRVQLLDGAPSPILAGRTLWDVETGRKLPVDKPSFYPLDFFADGRRVLKSDFHGSAEIVDVHSGRSLFRFDDVNPGKEAIRYARLAGEVVLTRVEKSWDRVNVWERRHPEGWKGQFHRPEVFGAAFCGAAFLLLLLNRSRPFEGSINPT